MTSNSTKILGFALGTSSAVLVFFQIHVDLPETTVNVNLADPISILAITALGLQIAGRGADLWMRPHLSAWVVAASTALALAFVIGWLDFGVNNWALVNRLFGWVVLMGYAAAGAFIVLCAGRQGARRVCAAVVLTGCVVVATEVIQRLAYGLSVIEHPGPFDGYSANRNAFAFLLLAALACSLAYADVYERGPSRMLWRCCQATLFLGLFLCLSRSGLVITLVLIAGTLLFKISNRRAVFLSLGLAVAFYGALMVIVQAVPTALKIAHDILTIVSSFLEHAGFQLEFLRDCAKFSSLPSTLTRDPYTIGVSGQASNTEHALSIIAGLRLWAENPVFGAGLGAFIARGGDTAFAPTIHSTHVWLLAELGIVGSAIFAGLFLYILYPILKKSSHLEYPADRLTLFLMVVFVLFGLLHDMFYQRVFWLLLGAMCARPGALLRTPFTSNR